MDYLMIKDIIKLIVLFVVVFVLPLVSVILHHYYRDCVLYDKKRQLNRKASNLTSKLPDRDFLNENIFNSLSKDVQAENLRQTLDLKNTEDLIKIIQRINLNIPELSVAVKEIFMNYKLLQAYPILKNNRGLNISQDSCLCLINKLTKDQLNLLIFFILSYNNDIVKKLNQYIINLFRKEKKSDLIIKLGTTLSDILTTDTKIVLINYIIDNKLEEGLPWLISLVKFKEQSLTQFVVKSIESWFGFNKAIQILESKLETYYRLVDDVNPNNKGNNVALNQFDYYLDRTGLKNRINLAITMLKERKRLENKRITGALSIAEDSVKGGLFISAPNDVGQLSITEKEK